MASNLSNQVALGLHLSAGASDNMLTSAVYVYDETRAQGIQESLDSLYNSADEPLSDTDIDEACA